MIVGKVERIALLCGILILIRAVYLDLSSFDYVLLREACCSIASIKWSHQRPCWGSWP